MKQKKQGHPEEFIFKTFNAEDTNQNKTSLI